MNNGLAEHRNKVDVLIPAYEPVPAMHRTPQGRGAKLPGTRPDTGSSSSEVSKAPSNGTASATRIKILVLSVLVFQNSMVVITMRYSRMVSGTLYLPSTVVLLGELFKIVFCTVVLRWNHGSWSTLASLFKIHVLDRPRDCLNISVPAFLYLIQNNLTFLAISNIESATYQVLYQLKIFTTAIMSVCLLQKQLSLQHWVALFGLFLGVAMVQLSQVAPEKPDTPPSIPQSLSESHDADRVLSSDHSDIYRSQNAMVGFVAILIAVCCSGLSGVWFEKIVKTTSTSLWIRNFQLALVSLVLAIGSVIVKDREAILKDGFFQGYTPVVYGVILLQAGGGLLVAMVVKYADNILKGFACSLATILSTIVSIYLFHFQPSSQFLFGSMFVLASAFYYGVVDGKKKVSRNVETKGHHAVISKV